MGHVDRKDLYALFHALDRHHGGEAPLDGIEVDEELATALRRLRRERFTQPPASEHRLKAERIREMLGHARGCRACRIVVFEEGPLSERRKSTQEKKAEADALELEERRLKRRFFISAAYGCASLGAARITITKYFTITAKPPPAGPTLQSPQASQFQIHPLQIVFFVFVLIAAFGISDAWQIANRFWIDYTRAKRAVPIIGKRWAERSLKKSKERRGPGQA